MSDDSDLNMTGSCYVVIKPQSLTLSYLTTMLLVNLNKREGK